MARPPRSRRDIAFGRAVSTAIRTARGSRTARDISEQSGVAIDTLRALESGRVASPGLLVLGQVTDCLALTLDDLYRQALQDAEAETTNG